MAQRTQGLHSILGLPAFYVLFDKAISSSNLRRTLLDQYIRPKRGDRVIDIGCGPDPSWLDLDDVIYTGIDNERAYIEAARTKYADRATFIHASVGEMIDRIEGHFDLALAIGVLHHLDDAEAQLLFALARKVLVPGGRLVTLDCAFTERQNPIARLLISLDRGKSVRTPAGYLAIAQQTFERIESDTRTDLLRVPYTHFKMTCYR